MLPFLPQEFASNEAVPNILIGYASVTSQGGTSVFDVPSHSTSSAPFHATGAHRVTARQALESVGLTILAESQLGYSVAGPPGAFEALTGGVVVSRERLMYAEGGQQRYVTHLDIVGEGQPEVLGLGYVPESSSQIEGLVLESPRIPMLVTPSPLPPPVSKFHLRVPDDVAVLLNARQAHQQGQIGANVNVTMIDSGQYPHPFFLAHHYQVRPTIAMVPGTSPTRDPVGHGTGESANIFAAAPGAVLQPIRVSDSQGNLVAVIAGFQAAKAAAVKPRIITNSWGGSLPFPPATPQPPAFEQALIHEIQDAIHQGIVVVFSAGNGQFSVEPQIPGVISVGGVFISAIHTLQASNYTSGYHSPWFGGVNVPAVSGLVGMLPRAQYLLLPIPPGCDIDVKESQSVPGDTPDGTAPDDGWALFSGTSAAAPQIAGICALLLSVRPHLTIPQLRQCLTATATDIVLGHCNPNFNQPATPGPDLATGAGLVNAAAAVQHAIAHF
jgi:subtilisin family serine protease